MSTLSSLVQYTGMSSAFGAACGVKLSSLETKIIIILVIKRVDVNVESDLLI